MRQADLRTVLDNPGCFSENTD